MPKTTAEFARELDQAIAEHVRQLRETVDPLVEAYRALVPDGTPPSMAAMFDRAPERKAEPKPNRKRTTRQAAAGNPSFETGRANQEAIVQALSTADGPLSPAELGERLPIGDSAVRSNLAKLIGQGVVCEVEPARGPFPARYSLVSRRAEWDDPDQSDDDLDDVDEPDLPGEEPPAIEDDESSAAAIAAAAAPHSPTSQPGIVAAGTSARVRKALEREQRDREELGSSQASEQPLRPAGEQLVRTVVDTLQREAAKPRDVARELVLPPPEVAQAFRVAESRGWLERCQDGRYRATGAMPALNGATVAA